jgi:putative oxidoreductase
MKNNTDILLPGRPWRAVLFSGLLKIGGFAGVAGYMASQACRWQTSCSSA